MYLNAAQLLHRMGAKALAQIVKVRLGVSQLDEEVLTLVCVGSDTSHLVAEVVAVAIKAKARIDIAIESVTKTMNGYIAKVRNLPLSQEVIDQSPLENIAYYLVVYELMERADKQTESNFVQAMKQLRDISNGMMQLGEDDPEPVMGAALSVGQSVSKFHWGGFGL